MATRGEGKNGMAYD